MRVTYSIKSVARKDKQKQNDLLPVYYVIRINAVQVKIPAKIDVKLVNWDTAKGRLKKNTPNSVSTNAYLDKSEQEFKDFMNNNLLLGLPITPESVKHYFNGSDQHCFFTFYEEVIRTKMMKGSTKHVYEGTLKILKDFKPSLTFQEINPLLLQKFQHYLITVRKNSLAGTYNRHKNFKFMINEAIKNDLMQKNPYTGFRMARPEGRKGYLPIEQIRNLENITFPENSLYLEKYRDLFLFSCYTGVRFSDVIALTPFNVRDGKLEFTMSKTGKAISIPLISRAKDLIEKYKGMGDTLFPEVSNQKANKYLKIIGLMAGIDQNITFHLSRHSFASSLVNQDTNLQVVQELLGHSSVRQTEVYAKVDKSKITASLNLLEENYRGALNRAS